MGVDNVSGGGLNPISENNRESLFSQFRHTECDPKLGPKTTNATMLDNLKSIFPGRTLSNIGSNLCKLMGKGIQGVDAGGKPTSSSKESQFFSFPVVARIRGFLTQASLLIFGKQAFCSRESDMEFSKLFDMLNVSQEEE